MIYPGSDIFRLVDSDGVPLETVLDILEESGDALDVAGFCRAALDSGNYGPIKLRDMLRNCAHSSVPRHLIDAVVLQAAGVLECPAAT